MKVKCIDITDEYLTFGKTYEVFNEYFNGCYDEYQIIDDDNDLYYYPKKCFKLLSKIIEERNEKINKLLGI